MKTLLSVALLGLVLGVLEAASAAADDLPPVRVVPKVDLQRYLGKWYEIASFPQRFQRGCVGSMATYSLREDGEINVVNECHKETLDGPIKVAKGHAWVVDKATNAKLKVMFFWPFSGDYWIIDLGPNYEYAVVGDPSRQYLWILSRTPALEEQVLKGIRERLLEQKFDLSKLQMTPQKVSKP